MADHSIDLIRNKGNDVRPMTLIYVIISYSARFLKINIIIITIVNNTVINGRVAGKVNVPF